MTDLLDRKSTYNVVATPWVYRLLVQSTSIVTRLDEVVLDGQSPVIERGPRGPRSAVVLAHKGVCRSFSHAVVNGLESLVLAHVFHHLVGTPSLILCNDGPVVVVLLRATDVCVLLSASSWSIRQSDHVHIM